MAQITDIIDLIHPASNAVAVILSDQIWVLFDREIDENSVNEGNFFVEGPDTDSVIGANYEINLPNVTNSSDPLASPGYRGVVQGTFTFEKIKVGEISAYSGFDTSGTGTVWRTKVIFTPHNRLQKNTQYTVYISGDEDSADQLSTGIRARSVFDTINGLNAGTGEATFLGTYTGAAATDTFHVKIVSAGEAEDASFVWWKGTNPLLIHGPISTDEYESVYLDNDVYIRFKDGNFAVDDTFTVVVKTPEIFTGNSYWSFTTGSGSIQEIPTSTSTTVTGLPTGTSSSTTSTSELSVLSTFPIDESTNIAITVSGLTITFSEPLLSLPAITIETEPNIGFDDSETVDIVTSGLLVHTDTLASNIVSIALAPNQIQQNNLIIVTVDKDTATGSVSGDQLSEDFTFWFTSKYYPLYSSVRKVRLEVGSLIMSVKDDTINRAIYEASLLADQLTWGVVQNTELYKFARREWVTCKAAQILLLNSISSNGLRSKKLDNLEVEYDTDLGKDLLDKINNCLAKWEKELASGGAAVQTPAYFVKGACDPDSPNVGRMWEKGPNSYPVPGSNTRYRPAGSRRYIGGWKNPWSKG
jgi:hypothetical protein